MNPKIPLSPPAAAGLAGLALGLLLSTSWSSGEVREELSRVTELPAPEALDPVRALPRTTLAIAMAEARVNLADGLPWAAWDALDEHLEDPAEASPSAVLLGARAASEWGGWREVRGLLNGRSWLDREGDGRGWYLLGRAEQEREAWGAAAAAYRRYVALADGRERGLAAARLGQMLREEGRNREAALAFDAAAEDLPGVGDWLRALGADAAAEEGAVLGAARAEDAAPARARRARAEARAWLEAGDTAAALRVLEREARALTAMGDGAEAAPLVVDRARLLLARGEALGARGLLRMVAANGSAPVEARLDAARLLGDRFASRTPDEELARAAAYEAGSQPGLAARALRAAGAANDPALQLRRGRLLYDESDFGPARAALQDAASRLADPRLVAEAELLAARARVRGGDRSGGIDELTRIIERRPGTPQAGTAAFLLGDLGSDRELAIERYRQAAAIVGSPDAREALLRVGDRLLRADDPAAALRAWETYVARYPHGEQTADVAYRVGLMHERAGRESQARAMYTAARLADPVSYSATLAANRLGVNPLDGVLRQPRPWIGLADDPRAAAAVLRRLDLLEEAGMEREWEAERDAAERRFSRRPVALLTLAEGLRDRGHTISAIRIGRQLLDARGGVWDGRLLRVVFPLPFRGILQREAERRDVDPMLLAALVRQESSWNPEARSWVGATGLGQIMPATGKWLASSVGIEEWDVRYLQVPEVNLRMSAEYLGDLLNRYDDASDLALAGYNAGPSRADRWRRELGYARDPEAFRERIPFDETRHYVKVVLRNAAVYHALYGDDAPGLVRAQ